MRAKLPCAVMMLGLILSAPARGMAFTFNTIDYPGAAATAASGINDAGQIVGVFCVGFSCHSFLKDGTTFTQLPEVPGATVTRAHGINNAGQIVGEFVDATNSIHGFLFLMDGATFTTIDVPGATLTTARGINDAGQIVGYFEDATGGHGFLKDGATFTTIDVPGATYTAASGINDAGQIVGHFGDPNYYGENHAFLREGATVTPIDVPRATHSDATGINKAGQIVGLFLDGATDTYHGFLKDGATVTPIDVPGASFTRPWEINDAGQIVGHFFDAAGVEHGFVTSGTAPVPLAVAIDIKPGSFPNSINPQSRGSVPVALLSSPTFDATTADGSTVKFASASPENNGGPQDVNRDRLLDVVFHFATQSLNLPDGTTRACLTGKTTNGTEFEGCDSVQLVP